MLKVASWNVNSLNVRLEPVLAWLDASNTDVLALQETKVPDEKFPLDAFLERGYHVAFSGQKTYNGVAIISRTPLEDVVMDVPGFDDPQRRFMACTVAGVRLIDLYVPNGSEVGSEKYDYKLNWLQHVTAYIQEELVRYPNLVVVGDFNIAPDDRDVHNPARWEGSVLVSPPEREAYQNLLELGLFDSFRLFDQPRDAFSWWDYRGAGFRQNHGLRIDLLLLSEALKMRCFESNIDAEPRAAERPSDHAPVWVMLAP